MRCGRLAGLFMLLAVLGEPAAPAFGQQNPATRGADATPRFALQARLAAPVVEHVASAASPFPDACGDRSGTLYIGAEVEPHIAADPRNPDHLVAAWQQDRYANGGSRGQVSAVSFDGGATWTRAAMPVSVCAGGEYARATDPWVSFAPDGTAYQIALGIAGELNTPGSVSGVLVFRSADGGLSWGPPTTIARDTGSLFDDKETITADPTDVRYVYAVWDRLHGETSSATVFARSTDGGANWEPSREIYAPPGGNDNTIGNLIGVLPDGTLVNVFMQLNAGSSPTIQVMRSSDKGATWSAPILVSAAGALGAEDPDTGTWIRDASIIPQMAVAPDGTLYMVWQDARFTQQRDGIAFSSSKDGGLTWSAPVRVNSNPAVTAFIPQVHVRSDGVIGVTYYDLRSNSIDPATLPTDFWLARSTDGVNWSETRVGPAFDLASAPFAGGLFLGDYTGLTSSGTSFIALYAKTTGDPANRNDVYVARIGVPAAADAKRTAYAAQSLPERAPEAGFWERVNRNAARAMQGRYLNVQR